MVYYYEIKVRNPSVNHDFMLVVPIFHSPNDDFLAIGNNPHMKNMKQSIKDSEFKWHMRRKKLEM